MAAFLEFHVLGGGCALVDASMIGAVMASGTDVRRVGTPDAPVRIILRAGETLDIIGNSAVGVLGRCVLAREEAKKAKYEGGIEVYVDYLTPVGGADVSDNRN